MKARHGVLVTTVMALGLARAHAASAPAEVDIEFLEFLGSLDTEDEEWRDYLAERPARTEAGKPTSSAAGKPEPRKAPATTTEQKQEKTKVEKP